MHRNQPSWLLVRQQDPALLLGNLGSGFWQLSRKQSLASVLCEFVGLDIPLPTGEKGLYCASSLFTIYKTGA